MITAARYAALTGDDATAGGDVDDAVVDATDLLEEYLGRTLTYGEHTETLIPDREGRLWPRVTPIAEAEGWTVDGLALLGTRLGWYWGEDTVEVTYTGGWDDARDPDPAAPALPLHLQLDIAQAAYRLLHPTIATDVQIPAGATSVRLGDAAVSGKSLGGVSSDSWWSAKTRGYRYAPLGSRTPTTGALL